MKYIDKIYGEVEFVEPVILDLLNTKTINRLKNIHQSGATYLVRKGRNGSRYDHSLGVMILIKKLGGSLKEQVAGLLHDVSHTAFSHVIDQVFGDTKEAFHEEKKHWLFERSDIMPVLLNHKLDITEIMDENRWGILEQPQPDLCADRIDYTLRDQFELGKISTNEINSFLESLLINNNKIIQKDISAGMWFVKLYHDEVLNLFMNPLEIYANNHLATAIKLALKDKIIVIEDMLLKDDNEILFLLKCSKNEEVARILNDLNFYIKVEMNLDHYDYVGYSKSRIVDPLILQLNGNLIRSTQLQPDLANLNSIVKQKALTGIYVRKLN